VLEQIGPYRIVRKLGEGGMGVVFAAEDERLRRAVAIKTLRECNDDATRERFFREARAAASLSHPNVCQLFDIGDIDGKPYIVMELLDGESLSDKLSRGALPMADALNVTLSILTALEALHARGFVHRDLKPSNVFLASHGVKLLDFGLARELIPAQLSPDATTLSPSASPLTLSGMIIGTPRYMAPEQMMNGAIDARTDLFSAGSLLFEMISGRPPFDDPNVMKLFHAIVYENPPNLAGSAAIAAINRIIHRAMAKRPEDRYQSAGAMAQDLREIMLISDAAAPVVAHRVTRLLVLPFRVLRADPDTEFLAQALPEAITTSLAGIGSLIVRSSISALRFANENDLKKISIEADVDVVVSGTLIRAGDQLRISTQLVAVPAGTVIGSMNAQTTMSDLFALQDQLTQRIVESLELPLSEGEAKLVKRDVPATPRAHEFYLRAGQQGESPEAWAIARDLYLRALDEDPRYAPAWAKLARIYLLLGKYGSESAKYYELSESAAKRALELNPDLPSAHYAYAQLEASSGRALVSALRLLDNVARGSNDPYVFAALVTVLRFCGLLEQSAAAHEQARALDPHISTSAAHTYWMMGRNEEALAAVDPDRDFGDAAFIYESMGRLDEAVAVFDDRKRRLTEIGARPASAGFRVFDMFRAIIEVRHEDAMKLMGSLRDFPDPEGLYYMGRSLARVGREEEAIDELQTAVERGFFCYPFFVRDPWLDPLRGNPRFVEVLRRAEARTREAQRAFDEHPASRVLNAGARR
jgi:serine/threonine protein kinase/tetratricopeptide (TPR) repeat protein